MRNFLELQYLFDDLDEGNMGLRNEKNQKQTKNNLGLT